MALCHADIPSFFLSYLGYLPHGTMLCNIDVFIGDQVAQAASKFQAANAQRVVIIYECSISTDICSDELLNNKQMGKIWDLIIDNILAEKGANFSLLSPV